MVLLTLALAACGGDEGVETQSGSPAGPGSPPVQPSDPGDPSDLNRAPAISGSPSPQIMHGTVYTFTPAASDPDGDNLTFSVVNLPDWADFDPTTGRLTGTPEVGDVGTYPQIGISVSDGEATAVLPGFDIEVVATAMGSATLSWQAPDQRTDGSPVDLAGYKVYWGMSSGGYSNSEEIQSPGQLTHVIDELTPATWYFAVTAVDSQGVESDFSNEASKQIL